MPYYKRHMFFCTNCRDDGNVCCEDHDATEMRQYAKRRAKALNITGQGGVRVNTAGCMDRCSEGPIAVIYPDAVWYTYANREDIDEIIDEHLVNGRIVERLRI